MKRTILILLLAIYSTAIYAQKYKVKKGKILKDKEYVGDMVGTISMFKKTEGLAILHNGDTTVKIEEERIGDYVPELKSVSIFSLNFLNHNETIKAQTSYGLAKEKHVLKYIFSEIGVHVYKDGFKQEEIEAARSSENVKSAHQIIAENEEKKENWEELLESKLTTSDPYNKTQVTTVNAFGWMNPDFLPPHTKYLVWKTIGNDALEDEYKSQDRTLRILVGAIAYQKVENQHPNLRKNYLKVYRRLTRGTELDGEKLEYVPVGFIDLDDAFAEDELVLYKNGNKLDYGFEEEYSPLRLSQAAVSKLESVNLF